MSTINGVVFLFFLLSFSLLGLLFSQGSEILLELLIHGRQQNFIGVNRELSGGFSVR